MTTIVTNDVLQSLLRKQIGNLRSEGVDGNILKKAEELYDRLPASITKSKHANMSLLVVIPFNVIPFREQLKLMDIGKGPAYTYLNEHDMIDVHGMNCDVPYLVCDVEPGMETLNISPNDVVEHLSRKGRQPFIMSQAMALVVQQTTVFESHNLLVSGSRIRSDSGEKPGLYGLNLDTYAGKVKIKREDPADADPKWGTPSYSSTIFLDR